MTRAPLKFCNNDLRGAFGVATRKNKNKERNYKGRKNYIRKNESLTFGETSPFNKCGKSEMTHLLVDTAKDSTLSKHWDTVRCIKYIELILYLHFYEPRNKTN